MEYLKFFTTNTGFFYIPVACLGNIILLKNEKYKRSLSTLSNKIKYMEEILMVQVNRQTYK